MPSKQLTILLSKEPLLRQVYEIINNIMNEVVHMASPSVTTIDAVDFIGVVKDERLDRFTLPSLLSRKV